MKIQIEDASYLIMGPAALGMVFGAFLIGQYGKKSSLTKTINVGITLAALSLILLFLVESFGGAFLAIFLFVLFGFANALVNIPANTILQSATPDEIRGRVYGVLSSLIGGAAILPVAVTGLAADFFGTAKVALGVGILLLFYAIYRILKGRYNGITNY